MHAIEKILAKNSGRETVTTGEIITAKVDFAEINDLYLQTVYSFYEMGGEKVWDSERAAFVFDHYAPAPDMKSAANHREMREFAKKNNLKFHFDTECGVCHQVMPEAGVIYPGMIVVATDSHTTTHGAFGAMGTGCGATDMATILMTGELWFRVPEIIEVRLDGEAPKGVYPKDVILNVLQKIKADGAVYKAIDFTGSYVENLNVAGRMVICNMAVEMGAKTAYMQPNEDVLTYVKERAVRPYEVQYTDPDFKYEESYVFDVSKMEPQLACPHSVDNVDTLTNVVAKGEIKLDQGYIGSCTGGREEDIAIAAEILRGKHIPKYTRLVVVPASVEVMTACIEKGYIQDLMKAGATITSPGCGACLGAHEGVLAPNEVCITSTNRNFPGRMGSTEAEIYLASPATVAASILNGRITDPREYL
ncbi:MAG: 3-isopropylmalate dehydratase large subunit [Clostridia bacterium]|nr:3-isopropylmalate dehydratase large subunit [Clostridia bacterium]